MTKECYLRMTQAVRGQVERFPLREKLLRLPTLFCAGIYLTALGFLMLTRDGRLFHALVVPAVCFLVCTVLRPLINRQRPYDRFGVPPVGAYRPGKGKSMPSRHTASAAAIAFAVVFLFPTWSVAAAMLLLAGMIAALRVLSGQHYPSDVLAALLLSGVISFIGYGLF